MLYTILKGVNWMEVIIGVNRQDIESLTYAIELLKEKDNEARKTMYVYPNQVTKAINRLTLLRYNIQEEMDQERNK